MINARDKKIIKLYRKGFNMMQIANKFKITRERVRQILAKNKTPKHKFLSTIIKENIEKVKTLMQMGLSSSQIANAFGVSLEFYYSILRDEGISIKNLKPPVFCACGKPGKVKGMCGRCYRKNKYHTDPVYRDTIRKATKKWVDENQEKYDAYQRGYQKLYQRERWQKIKNGL